MKTVLLIGLGRFGRHIAMKLNELNQQVMAVGKKEKKGKPNLPFVAHAPSGENNRQELLLSPGVRH